VERKDMIALISSGSLRSIRIARPFLNFWDGLRSFIGGVFTSAALTSLVMMLLVLPALQDAHARPTSKGKSSSGGMQVQKFLRQLNVYSNIEFYYTNRGVDFYAGVGQDEGCFWPRGSGDSYIFGGGLWFACKKEIEGKRHQLCELGYNPNSGAGWFIEGENSQAGLAIGTDGAAHDNKYISYVGPRYDAVQGTYIPGSSTVLSSPYYNWPLWDTSTTKTINHNYYFGDYISNVTDRNITSLKAANPQLAVIGKTPKPVITSEEDILNFYSDNPTTDNPEYIPNTGYPFGIDIQEEIYSWSFGRYRDMIFERFKTTNSSGDSLLDCWMSPAWDPDLDASGPGAAGEDANSYVDSLLVYKTVPASKTYTDQLREPYKTHPEKYNMGVQWRNYTVPPPTGQYGWIGFSFLESPVFDANGNIIANDDSVDLGGYGPNSLFQKNQLGLVTFQDWIILNDPSTADLRYDFVSAGTKALWNGVYQDQRLLEGTGPFTLPPGKSVETTIAICIAQANTTSYQDNFGAVLLLTDFAHQVFGEVDSTPITILDTGTPPKPDTTAKSYFVNHFVSPNPPNIPDLQATALDQAVLLTWDTNAEISKHNILPTAAQINDTSLAFLGYQLWRSSRSDHDSTIRPTGTNPDILLGTWQLYNFTTDSVFDSKGHFNHFHYTRTNKIPNPIPHSYLDVGDDNHTGVLPQSGSGNLYDNVPYYYYLIAFNEFDSLNNVGPLYSAVVPPKNFVVGTPNKPVFLVPFAGDSTVGLDCQAGSGIISDTSGGLQNVSLSIVDTGIFASLFTNDTINVSFQPRWTEYVDNQLDQSPLTFDVSVTENRNNVQNTFSNLTNATNGTTGYFFPLSLPGTLVYHVDGTLKTDSVFNVQFTTNDQTFAPNQTIDQAFYVLTSVNLEQLSAPYRLDSVTVPSSDVGDPNILRLSRRTNNGNAALPAQSIYDLHYTDSVTNYTDSVQGIPNVNGGATRPSFLGALGQTTYQITFGNYVSPGPVAIMLQDGDVINPDVMPVTISIADCPKSILQSVPPNAQTADSANDMVLEQDYHFYSATGTSSIGTLVPAFSDPDQMWVPIPGWYELSAFHYTDAANFSSQHTSPAFNGQGASAGATVGNYYFPMGTPTNSHGNIDTGAGAPSYHLVVHELRIGGAEIIFNAPEISDQTDIGDTIAGNVPGHTSPHLNDFAPNDKVLLSFTGMMKNLPFPGANFQIKTQSGPAVSFADSNNYVDSILAQVQVVPNPYIVSQLGQTDAGSQLYFTRLPPRCTIQIYALDGTLVNTIEHIGYTSTTSSVANDPATVTTTYNYNQLSNQSSVETWNLQTSGQQLVGSQVLFARVVAKDPYSGAEVGEITTKFAVIIGLTK
jgi:hypothetical protein